MGLGRGLASLIPKRDKGMTDDLLEQIDSMEEVHEEPARASGKRATRAPSDAVEDFGDLEGDEKIAPPAKPLVTPIFIDQENVVQKISVSAEADEDEAE